MTAPISAGCVAALRQGGAPAHATHSTQAPAAQKRGGGMARRIQLIAIAQGRQPMPEGGAIKPLLRSSRHIPTQPSAHAEGTHTHERLRRGAKHIATLRLMTRSPAQLVEGEAPTEAHR